jgi:hypothetical protein
MIRASKDNSIGCCDLNCGHDPRFSLTPTRADLPNGSWACPPCLGYLGLQEQAGTATEGEGGNEGQAGGGAAESDLEIHGSNWWRDLAPDLFKIGPIGMRSGELDHGRL